jgi:hypothetical protein
MGEILELLGTTNTMPMSSMDEIGIAAGVRQLTQANEIRLAVES